MGGRAAQAIYCVNVEHENCGERGQGKYGSLVSCERTENTVVKRAVALYNFLPFDGFM